MSFELYIKNTTLSRDVGDDVYIKDNNIYMKDDDSKVLVNIDSYSYKSIVQLIKDYITKNYECEYELGDRIPLLMYMVSNDADTDQYLLDRSRIYQHKPLLCLVRDDFENHSYIIGIHHRDINKAGEYIGLPKEGYSLYILDGKFTGTKTRLMNGITAYIIDPSYHIRNSDGMTTITVAGSDIKVKHIRRQL